MKKKQRKLHENQIETNNEINCTQTYRSCSFQIRTFCTMRKKAFIRSRLVSSFHYGVNCMWCACEIMTWFSFSFKCQLPLPLTPSLSPTIINKYNRNHFAQKRMPWFHPVGIPNSIGIWTRYWSEKLSNNVAKTKPIFWVRQSIKSIWLNIE